MNYFIALFGVLIILAGIGLLLRPSQMFSFLEKNAGLLSLQVLAVFGRLLIGIVLIAYANQTKFPVFLGFFGWLAVIAGISLGVIGRSRFEQMVKLMVHAIELPVARVGGVLAGLFGAFLIYAVM
jgi:hypothetical protein